MCEPQISSENGGQSSKPRRRCCTPRPHTWQARTAGRQRPTAAPARAGSRVLGAYRRQDGARGCQNGSRIAGGMEPNAPSRSGKTGWKGCRRPGRRGRHAGCPTRARRRRRRKEHGPRPSAGDQTARAQAQTRAPTRAASLAAGLHAGHTMRDACGPHNAGRMQTCEQTGRGERDRSCGQRHRARHGHGQGHDMGTGSDAFGITSLAGRREGNVYNII